MRESCSCGAFIQTARYRRVKDWRGSHRCPDRPQPEPDKQGAIAIVEQADEPHGHGDGKRYFPVINAKHIGFTMNPEA